MPWLNIDIAVGLALAGRQPTEILPPTMDMGRDRGFSAVVFDARIEKSAAVGTTIAERQLSYDGLKTTIPIVHFKPRGHRLVSLWPCLTYQLIHDEFNSKRYIYKADRFAMPVVGSNVEVQLYNQKGVRGQTVDASSRTTLVGPALRRIRDNPEPFDLIFEIGLWASDHNEHHMMHRLLMEVFPARGSLMSVQNDGTLKSWEMYLQGSTDVDDEEPTLEDQERKLFGVLYTYVVETFVDNTNVTRLTRTFTGTPEITVETKE